MQKTQRIFEYEFALTVKTCQIRIKFPCTFTVSWKIDKNFVNDATKVPLVKDVVEFDTTLRLKTYVLYNSNMTKFLEKKSTVTVSLCSNSRPEEIKVAGIVTLYLSKFINESEFADVYMMYPLERCPDRNSQICLSVGFKKLQYVKMEYATQYFKMPTDVSSIGKAQSIVSSEYNDLRDLQFDEQESQNNSKRINSLPRNHTKNQAKPRVSMQPLITEESEENVLRKVKSNESLFQQPKLEHAKSAHNIHHNVSASPSRQEIDLHEKMESLKEVNESLEQYNYQIKSEIISCKKLNQELSYELQELNAKFERLAKKDLQVKQENELLFGDYEVYIQRLRREIDEKTIVIDEMKKSFKKHNISEDNFLRNQYKIKFFYQKSKYLQNTIDYMTIRLADHDSLSRNCYHLEQENKKLQQYIDQSEQQLYSITKEKDKVIVEMYKTIENYTKHFQNLKLDMETLESYNILLKKYINLLNDYLEYQYSAFKYEMINVREALMESMTSDDLTAYSIRTLYEEFSKVQDILLKRTYHIIYFENRINDLEREVNELNYYKDSRSMISYSNAYSIVLNREDMEMEEEVTTKKPGHKYSPTTMSQNDIKHDVSAQNEMDKIKSVNVALMKENAKLGYAYKEIMDKNDLNEAVSRLLEHFRRRADVKDEYCEKVTIQDRIRQVSIEMQKMKVSLLKSSKGTTQIQQLVANMKPLQDKIFELLSHDRGIMGSPKKYQ